MALRSRGRGLLRIWAKPQDFWPRSTGFGPNRSHAALISTDPQARATHGPVPPVPQAVPPHLAVRRVGQHRQPGADPTRAVPAAELTIHFGQRRQWMNQQVFCGVSAPHVRRVCEHAIATEVDAVLRPLAVVVSVVLVDEPGPCHSRSARPRNRPVSSTRSTCGFTGMSTTRWNTRRRTSHADSARGSLRSAAVASVRTPDRRDEQISHRSGMRRWPHRRAESINGAMSSGPRSRAHLSRISAGESTGSPSTMPGDP
jgi:hypothetical protein